MLAGSVVDQPQLHAMLSKVRDMGLTLISVRQTVGGEWGGTAWIVVTMKSCPTTRIFDGFTTADIT